MIVLPPSPVVMSSYLSSTSPICGRPQTNVMVSSDGLCNNDSELIVDDPLSLSCCNASFLYLNTHSTINFIPASVDSPCISLLKA